MAPQKRANYKRFPVGKYTAALKRGQEELVINLVEENKKLKVKRVKLKRLQDRVSYLRMLLFYSKLYTPFYRLWWSVKNHFWQT